MDALISENESQHAEISCLDAATGRLTDRN